MLKLTQLLLPLLIAIAASLALTPLARRLAIRVGAVDLPDPRKVHKEPMPLLGGVAVVASVFLTFGLIRIAWPGHVLSRVDEELVVGVGLGMLPVLLASLWDDVRSLPSWPRFAAQAAGAAIAISHGVCLAPTVHLFGGDVQLGVLAIPLSMLWIVGVTNAFNLIDGLDGLSAGLALVSAGSLAAVFAVANQPEMAAASLVVAGALIGFLPFNMHPARIFLGDTGAATIGFCLACFALRGGSTLSSGFAAAMPVFVMGLPIADTLVAMARRSLGRLATGKGGMFQPDRNHLHHRLLACGVNHRTAVFMLYGAGLLVAGVGLLSVLVTAFEAGLLLMGLMLAGFVGLARLGYEEFAVVRNGLVLRFYEAPVLRRSFFAVFADVAMVLVAVSVALLLKFDAGGLPTRTHLAVSMAGVLLPMTIATIWGFRLYRGTWRLAGIDDFRRLATAIATATFVAFLAHGLMFGQEAGPSVFVIYMLVMLVLAGGGRVSYRVFLTRHDSAKHEGTPVLVYGAGVTGGRLLPQLLADSVFGMHAVGFIDDDPAKQGKLVNGIPVWGDVKNLELAIQQSGARKVVVASRRIGPDRLEHARAECERQGIELLRMAVVFDQLSTGGAEPVMSARQTTAAKANPEEMVRWTGPAPTRQVSPS